MTDTEIRKACAKLMGKCWHELVGTFLCACGHTPDCSPLCQGCMESHLVANENPDPLNSKSDWADLVFFVVNKWEGRPDFIWIHGLGRCIAMDLLSNQRALPEALALYEKEKDV